MIKQCLINFFKRFKYFFIPFSLILVGFIGGAGIFYGGLTLTLHLQDDNLMEEVMRYFKEGFQNIKPSDILSLSIVNKIYNDFLAIAGDKAFNVKVGITLSAIVAVIAIYSSYKESVAIVNYISKRQLRNEKTKHGFIPFIIKLSIGVLFSTLLMILLHLWSWSFIFVLLIYIVADSFEAIVSIRYVYYSNISLKKFIVSKNFIRIMSLFLIYQYSIIFLASALWFITPFISLFIMIPVLAYSETNIEYTIITTYKT